MVSFHGMVSLMRTPYMDSAEKRYRDGPAKRRGKGGEGREGKKRRELSFTITRTKQAYNARGEGKRLVVPAVVDVCYR